MHAGKLAPVTPRNVMVTTLITTLITTTMPQRCLCLADIHEHLPRQDQARLQRRVSAPSPIEVGAGVWRAAWCWYACFEDVIKFGSVN